MAGGRAVAGSGEGAARGSIDATGGGRGEGDRRGPADGDGRGGAGPGPAAHGSNPRGEPIDTVSEAGRAFRRDPDGIWYRVLDETPIIDARDLTLGDLFDPPEGEVDGEAVRLVPRAWASRHPDHPLAWTFEHADLGGRGPIPVPADAWARRADRVVAMAAPTLHPWKLIGPDGVAALLGVAEATVRAYLARDQMPEPLVRIGRTPVWSIDQIEAWQTTRARARPPSFTPRPAPGPIESDDDSADADRVPSGGTSGATS